MTGGAFVFRMLVTLIAVAAAAIAGLALWDYYMDAPWTRDGRVRSDVVAIAPDVSGLVSEVLVSDNQTVRRGDVLFRIDPERFRLALRQAEAVVAGKQAALDQAAADYDRYSKLTSAAVTQQKLEAALAAKLTAGAELAHAIADRDLARLNLERASVRASVNGTVANLDLLPGAYVAAGRGVLALIDADSLRVEGYFEETKLARIHVGDPVEIRLMGDDAVLRGRVESIAGGIADRERSAGANLLANVNPTFAWVRLSQRIPVRVALDPGIDRSRLISGRTATVSVVGESSREGWSRLLQPWRR